MAKTSAAHLPRYGELPTIESAPAGSAWGLFGDADRLGTLNLITESDIASAAALVRRGRVFRLDLPLDGVRPGLMGRKPPEHHAWSKGDGTASDDYLDGFYPQASSHWDALRHIRHPNDGFYNATREEAVGSQGQLGIDVIAKRGVVGRGVLLDIAHYAESIGRPIDPNAGTEITPEMLDECAAAQGLELRSGDILLIRTGWIRWYLAASEEEREAIASKPGYVVTSGIGPADPTAEYLWNRHFAAVAADNVAVEPSGKGGHLHRKVIPHFGMLLGELWYLEELADDCRADGIYEFMLMSAPLYQVGGVASPANALALK